MKFALIGPILPYRGGISQYNTILGNELSKKFETKIISWRRRYPSFMYPHEQVDGDKKSILKKDPRFILDYLNPFTWVRAFFIIKKGKFDTLVFHWVSPAMVPVFFSISLLVKLFTKTKILFISHCTLPHERTFVDKFLAKLMFSLVDYFIVHSKVDEFNLKKLKKRKLRYKLGFLPENIVFNKDKFDIVNIKKELKLKKKVALFFGYVREYKGLKYLLKALPDVLKKTDMDLLIVGEFWEDKKDYLELIDKLNLKNNVKLIDKYVPDAEVGKYFSVSDVVVLPYTSATQSGIVQIAFGFNKPVITTDVGGLPESVLDNNTGMLIKPKEHKSISEALIKFYNNNLSNEFSDNVIKEKKRFGWNKYIENIISVQKD